MDSSLAIGVIDEGDLQDIAAAVGDALTAGITVLSLVVLVLWKKCPDPLLVAVGAVIGLAAYQVIRPDWLLQ